VPDAIRRWWTGLSIYEQRQFKLWEGLAAAAAVWQIVVGRYSTAVYVVGSLTALCIFLIWALRRTDPDIAEESGPWLSRSWLVPIACGVSWLGLSWFWLALNAH
jgi:hypothetical protein